MRFTTFFAAFLILSFSAWAQRGGGHGSIAGAHGGGGHVGSGLSIHAGPQLPWNAGGPAGPQNPWATTGNYGRAGNYGGNYSRYGYGRYYGDQGLRGTARYYRQIPYLWGLYPNYYDPFLFGDSGYYDQPNYYGNYQDPYAYSNGYGPEPDPQLAYLSAEIQQLSSQLNNPQQQGVPASTAQPAPPAAPPVTLALKDGKHLQVQNYAVMGETFWDFTTQPVKKIPLSDIDVAQSQKLSAANGAEFPNLTSSGESGK